jgi:hypothetical protein
MNVCRLCGAEAPERPKGVELLLGGPMCDRCLESEAAADNDREVRRLHAGIDRLLRGAVGVGDQTPRDMPLSPFEAEALAEAIENATMWLHDAWKEIPASSPAEQEDRNERMAHLHLLRSRLLALHFGDEVPR